MHTTFHPRRTARLTVIAVSLFVSTIALSLPVSETMFKEFAATRDAALGNKLYESTDMVVFSRLIDPATGKCSTVTTPVHSDDYKNKLDSYLKAKSEWNALKSASDSALEPEIVKLEAEYRQMIDRAPQRDEKSRLNNERRNKIMQMYADARRHLPQIPEKPKEELVNLNFSEVTLLMKTKAPTVPLIDTETPFQDTAQGYDRKPTARVLTMARETYLPIVERLCADIERLHVHLGFYALVRANAGEFRSSVAGAWAPLLMPLVKSASGWEVKNTQLDSRLGTGAGGSHATLAGEMEIWGDQKGLVWKEVSEAELAARRRLPPTADDIMSAILREHQQLSGANVNFKTGVIENAYFGGAYVRKVERVDHIECKPIKDGHQCRFHIAGEAYYTNSGGAAILRAMMESKTGSSVEKTEGTVTRQFVLTKQGWRSPDEAASIRAQQEKNTEQMIKGAAAGMCAFAREPEDIWATPGCRN